MKTEKIERESRCQACLETAAGPVAVRWGPSGLLSIDLGIPCPAEGCLPEEFLGFLENLRLYFRGEKVRFKVRMDLRGLTKFQREVLKECSRIPWGATRSYGDLARGIGNPKAARAVGQAVGRNPIPVVIPCHRVLASGGGMGGFGSGLDWKRFLLNLEGIRIEAIHP